jgi:hypothetical protein
MKVSKFISIVPAFLLLAACSTPSAWSPTEQSELSDIAIKATVISDNANIGIDHTDDKSLLLDDKTPGQGGLLGIVMLAAADGIANQYQSSTAEQEDGKHIPIVQAAIPQDMDSRVNQIITEAIRKHPQLGTKISNKSTNHISSKVEKFGFKRLERANKVTKYGFIMTVSVAQNANGKTHFTKKFFTFSEPRTLKAYAENPALIESAITEAFTDFSNELQVMF